MKQTRLRTKRYPAGRGLQRLVALTLFAAALFILSQTIRFGGAPTATPAPIAPVTPTPAAIVAPTPGTTQLVDEVPQPGFATQAPDQTGSQSVFVPAQDWYAIQFGAYSSDEAARKQAGQYVGRGAAGYTLEDTSFRVLAAVYNSRDEAETIKARLKDGQGIDSYIYRLSADAVELAVTAAPAQIEALQNSYDALNAALQELGRLSMELDKQRIDGAGVILATQEVRLNILAKQKALEQALSGSQSDVVVGLRNLLDNAAQGLETICMQNAQETVIMTSKIKYHQIDLLWRYVQYTRQITAQRI